VIKPPEQAHPTVSIDKVVMLGDVPILLFPPDGEIESPEIRLLIAAIDGESTIQQIAEVAGVDPKHAQAVFAQLKSEGCISILSSAHSPHSARTLDTGEAPSEPQLPHDPFQGLRPRTK
jgi:hypothetical protein